MSYYQATCNGCRRNVWPAANQSAIHPSGTACFDTFHFNCLACGHQSTGIASPYLVGYLTSIGVPTAQPDTFEPAVVRFADQLGDDEAVAAELEQLGQP